MISYGFPFTFSKSFLRVPFDEKGIPRRVRQKPQEKKKKMTEKEVLDILRTIVTIGDPEYRYTDFKKIGQV